MNCCVFHRSGGHKSLFCATVPTSEAGRHEFAAGCNETRCLCDYADWQANVEQSRAEVAAILGSVL